MSEPLVAEKVLDGVKKDLTIENIQRLMLEYKDLADAWAPKFSFNINAHDGNAVSFTLMLGDQNNPASCQGLTYTLPNADVVYLSDGNTLVEDLSDNLVTLYEGLLRDVIRNTIRGLPENI